MPTVWEQLEAECLRIYSLPHNVLFLRDKRKQTPADAAKARVAEVKSGRRPREAPRVSKPTLFLRVTGTSNAA